jgi:hypothetical protein
MEPEALFEAVPDSTTPLKEFGTPQVRQAR